MGYFMQDGIVLPAAQQYHAEFITLVEIQKKLILIMILHIILDLLIGEILIMMGMMTLLHLDLIGE